MHPGEKYEDHVQRHLPGIMCKYSGGREFRIAGEKSPKGSLSAGAAKDAADNVNGKVVSRDGRDVDIQFRDGAAKCLAIAEKEKPDLIILKSNSPSCAVRQHCDGTFSGTPVDGSGIAAELLIRNGFRVIEESDAP